ncbi:M23 family metallopeptidase [Alcanivorax sp. 24]|uniref:M23 family metallopeptidase n=1 Tax=Alcanivorax sp. 24 TaxID=2545266 RepID=UPI00105CC79E|nr:M23 family metallopeptidase [Alcanivorax sp. 24]
MNIIWLNSKGGHARSVQLSRYWLYLALSVMIALPVALGTGAYWLNYKLAPPAYTEAVAERFQHELNEQKREVADLSRLSAEQFRALTLQLADTEARLVRLDALGERLVDVAGIDGQEFDFSSAPAIGGPEVEGSSSFTPPSFMQELERVTTALQRREQQLDILEKLLANRQLKDETFLSGRPIPHGWMSSRYGRRTDPFSGRVAWHKGVDFAARDGSPIIATASGVVTYAGRKTGYGQLVEINHGNGISSRYAHAKSVTVEVGDIVRTGDTVAIVGSSGRSTGPHVHYEVLKNGQQVDPSPYIARARR